MEVEYKDFKVSELLDIKLRKKVPARKETPKTKSEGKRPKDEASAGEKNLGPKSPPLFS